MSNINLVSANVVGLEKERARLKIFRIAAVICLIIVTLLSVLIFVLNITLPIETIKKQQQATIVGISFFHKKLTEYTLLSDRIKNTSNIISKREDYGNQINEIFNKIPADSSIDALNIQPGKMIIIVSSASLFSINKFIDNMVAFGVQGKIIKNVIIQGLTLNVDGGKYSLSLLAQFP